MTFGQDFIGVLLLVRYTLVKISMPYGHASRTKFGVQSSEFGVRSSEFGVCPTGTLRERSSEYSLFSTETLRERGKQATENLDLIYLRNAINSVNFR